MKVSLVVVLTSGFRGIREIDAWQKFEQADVIMHFDLAGGDSDVRRKV